MQLLLFWLCYRSLMPCTVRHVRFSSDDISQKDPSSSPRGDFDIDIIRHAGDVPMTKVKVNANQEYQYITNFKVLQKAFKDHAIDKVSLTVLSLFDIQEVYVADRCCMGTTLSVSAYPRGQAHEVSTTPSDRTSKGTNSATVLHAFANQMYHVCIGVRCRTTSNSYNGSRSSGMPTGTGQNTMRLAERESHPHSHFDLSYIPANENTVHWLIK
jgi:hypothetical protein